MLQQGKLWDMDFSIPVQIIVIDCPKSLSVNEDKLTATMKRLENLPLDFLVQTSGILLMDKLVMFFFIERNKNRNQLKEQIYRLANYVFSDLHEIMPEIPIRLGVGKLYPSNAYLFKSYQEAKLSLKLSQYQESSNKIAFYEELGIIRLLSQINNEVLRNYAKEQVGELEIYDQENTTDLILTVKTYCENNGDINKTAEALYIHQNTLRNRIKKIEQILRKDLNNIEHLLDIFTAIIIMRILDYTT